VFRRSASTCPGPSCRRTSLQTIGATNERALSNDVLWAEVILFLRRCSAHACGRNGDTLGLTVTQPCYRKRTSWWLTNVMLESGAVPRFGQ